jgi:hypothetical protein
MKAGNLIQKNVLSLIAQPNLSSCYWCFQFCCCWNWSKDELGLFQLNVAWINRRGNGQTKYKTLEICFQDSIKLLCAGHKRENIERHLKSLKAVTSSINHIIADIFGRERQFQFCCCWNWSKDELGLWLQQLNVAWINRLGNGQTKYKTQEPNNPRISSKRPTYLEQNNSTRTRRMSWFALEAIIYQRKRG